MLLEKSYAMRPKAQAPRPSSAEAIVAATMEAVALYLRERRREDLTQLLPITAYLVIAPFLGAKGAASLIRGKLRERATDGS